MKHLPEKPAVAPVFIPYFAEARLANYFRLAGLVRRAGLGVEFYPDPKKLGNQLKYADRRGFRFALVVGDAEWDSNRAQVKDLASGASVSAALFDGDALSAELLSALNAKS